MTAKALFCPYPVPNSPGFQRILLYWDWVGAWATHDVELSLESKLGQLVSAGLLEFITPDPVVIQDVAFSAGYDELVRTQIATGWSPGQPKRLHSGDVPSGIWEVWHTRGLVLDSPGAEWAYVDGSAAALYSLYLTQIVSATVGAVAVTDQADHTGLCGIWPDGRPAFDWRGPTALMLRHVLPAPAGVTPPHYLVEFKARYAAELRAVRALVESKIVECMLERDITTRLDMVACVTADLAAETKAFREEMDAWFRIAVGALACAVVAGDSTAPHGGVTVAPGGDSGAGALVATRLARQVLGVGNPPPGEAVVYSLLHENWFAELTREMEAGVG